MPPRKKPASAAAGESASKPRSRAAVQISFEQLFTKLRTASASAAAGKPLLAALKEQELISPIVLVEAGGYRSRRLIDWVKTNLFGGRPDSIVTSFGSELSNAAAVDSLSGSLTSYSLLTPLQFAAIIDADKIKAAYASKIAAALVRGSEVTLAFLTTPDGDKPPLLKELCGSSLRCSIPALQGPALARWIAGEVSRTSADKTAGSEAPPSITADAAEYLAQLFGSDLANLSQEIEKLVLLTDHSEKIDTALVRKISIRESEHNSFELFQRIARKDAAGSVALVDLLINQGFHPLQIAAFLSKAVRTALAAKENDGGGAKLNSDIANPWFLRNISSGLSNLKPETLRHFLRILQRLDTDLKGSKLPPELVTSLAAARMAARNGPAAG